ncbi:protein of unknown function [Bradyrhizobium vignae]|uniref:Uncharacterized protein n=1 Tax=Bradyrhizobium vignae TaxID=1549949 RepID=A0A2U3PRS2_9BRAD|nr:protein of unknown function [Bradyrhizobium vignae]
MTRPLFQASEFGRDKSISPMDGFCGAAEGRGWVSLQAAASQEVSRASVSADPGSRIQHHTMREMGPGSAAQR